MSIPPGNISTEEQSFINPGPWRRESRARCFRFQALESEAWETILAALDPALAPYVIMASHSEVTPAGGRVEVPLSYDIPMLGVVPRDGIDRFHIRSRVVTPDLPLVRGDRVSACLALNGLISFSRSLGIHPLESASLGIVDRVFNDVNRGSVFHAEYSNLYNQLKKVLRSILIPVRLESQVGGDILTTDPFLASEAFIEKHGSGERRFIRVDNLKSGKPV